MKLLLDTHTLLWWLFDDPRLSARVAAVLRDPDHSVLVSSASAWEIATKHRLGRLASAAPLLQDYNGWLTRAGFTQLAIDARHAVAAGQWTVAHRDPFDRMLAAQSKLEDLPLATKDPALVDFGIATLW